MSKMHLTQPGITYSSCGPFTINKGRIQKFEETGDSRYIYQKELDKDSFQHEMAYGLFIIFSIKKLLVVVLKWEYVRPASGRRTTQTNYQKR